MTHDTKPHPDPHSILPDYITSALLLGLAILITPFLIRRLRLNLRLPPGPWGFPFLGYMSMLTYKDKLQLFKRLRAEYGDVFCMRLGNQLVVVVNGFDTIRQLFLQQGSSFVDRPKVFTFTHVGQGKGIVNSSGEVWKEHRKFALNTLRSLGIGQTSFKEKIHEEVLKMFQILDDTKGEDVDPGDHLQTAIANIVCSISFGKRFEYDDPIFVDFLSIFNENMSISGGTALLNFFPWLHYLPGDPFKSHRVLANVAYVQDHFRQWLDDHQKNYDPDNVGDFIDAYLKKLEDMRQSRKRTTFCYDQLLKVVGDLLVGGTETTGTTLRWAIIFLVRWPHVQDKMRQEIDSVYPDMTTPPVQDRKSLPYTEAAILECQRLADIAPFSVTHAASQDVTVDGVGFIPRGAIVIPNVRSVHYDPQLWQDPLDFRPERFLDDQGEVQRPDYFIPFFLGKRSCPGEGLARLELFQFLTMLIQRYTILPSSQGMLPSLEGHLGITYTPFPHKVRFVRRDRLSAGGE